VSSIGLVRAFADSCREARLPLDTSRGAGFSMLRRGEQDRLLDRGYRPYE
jgi:hypothetical protein